MHIIDDGLDLDCAPELGRTHFDDEHNQILDEPTTGAYVLMSEADYDRAVTAIDAAKIVRFMDDPRAMPELMFHVDNLTAEEYYSCTYRDPFTGRSGTEYADTPSGALKAALRTINHYQRQAGAQAAA